LGIPGTARAAKPPVPESPAIGAELSPRHKQWLEDVALLISPPETAAFLALKQDYQRDSFIRRFWQVRDPYPETGRNELEDRWKERSEIARQRYGNLTEDRAKMMLWNGVPAKTEDFRCPEAMLPIEVWSYTSNELIHGFFNLVFYQPTGGVRGAYRLWYPTEGPSRLLSLSASAVPPSQLGTPGDAESAAARAISSCPRGDSIITALSQSIDWSQAEAKLSLVPKPGDEWLKSFLSRSTDLPEGAGLLPARLDLAFPARRQNRTIVQGQLAVAKADAGLAKVGDRASYDFVVDGEVLREGELFDQFRYRFSLPESDARGADIPLVFERTLRPGTYRLIVRVEDAGGKRYFRDERELAVPGVPDAASPVVSSAPAIAPDPRLAEANAAIPAGEQTVRILAPTPGLKTGTARVEAITTGEGIAKLSFELNGRPILAKARPPWSVDLPLGNQPRAHQLRVRALDAQGNQLASDEILLNAGPHRFSVRLVEPQPGKSYRSSLRAQVQVEVPQGDDLDRVEMFLDETRVATLYQEPFVQPILLPEGDRVSYVRAVAYLRDGNSAEDTVLINAPESAEVDVDFVELYTSVIDRKGRPVDGLDKKDFKVTEDGVEQSIVRFEKVNDLPIYAGVLLDTSASMSEELNDAVQGALRFFETVITPKDRAMVLTFSDKPTVVVPFTNDKEVLAGGLANLVAEGNTALYDSIIQALFDFGGLRGKRAILLLSDGRDEGSHYTYSDALEYAKRSGVAIYSVGIHLSTKDADVRLKLLQLAEQTGGHFYFVDKAKDLEGVYKSIEEEVRTQYLLAYQSSQSGSGNRDKFRQVEIKLQRPGLEAKSIPGYYP
jgi:Ca-activated chloride channel family protein